MAKKKKTGSAKTKKAAPARKRATSKSSRSKGKPASTANTPKRAKAKPVKRGKNVRTKAIRKASGKVGPVVKAKGKAKVAVSKPVKKTAARKAVVGGSKKVAAKPIKPVAKKGTTKPAVASKAPRKVVTAKVQPIRTTVAPPVPAAKVVPVKPTAKAEPKDPTATAAKPAPTPSPSPSAAPAVAKPAVKTKPAAKRAMKERVQLEFEVRSTPTVLFELLSTPSGFSEWYCNDVNVRGDQYTFIWDGEEEHATLIGRKLGEVIRFRRNDEEDENAYFEFRIKIDPMTNEVALIVTDHAWPGEVEETRNLWTSQIASLVRVLGA